MEKDDLILSILMDLKNEVKELNIRVTRLFEKQSSQDIEIAGKVDREPDFNELKFKVEKIYIKTITWGVIVGGGIALIIEIAFKLWSIYNGG